MHSKRIRATDSLRGVAILLVIYHHVYAGPLRRAVAHYFGVYPWIIDHGWMGVSIFFTLSGFVLALPFFVGSTRKEGRQDAWRYYNRRSKRLRFVIPALQHFRHLLAARAGTSTCRRCHLGDAAINLRYD